MMRWIVGQSLKFRLIIVAAAGATMLFGALMLPKTPVDAFPEFAPPRVEVQVPCLGLSATEVEELVTVPIEQAMSGIPGLQVLRSKSVSDLSKIEARFETGTDLLRARQLVAERVALVTPSLPRWASPPFMIQPLSSTSRTLKVGLSSDTVSLEDMSMTSYWNIRARLLRVPGVANVAIWGERLKMYQVLTDPGRLNTNQVSLDQVMEATANALDSGLLQFSDGGFIGTGGFVETPSQRLNVENVLPIVTPEDLANVTLASRDGKVLRLADVADVVTGHQPLAGDAVINDGPGLMLIVEKFPWANTVNVTQGVEAAFDELRPGLTGINIDTTIFRPATFIELAIDNLTIALLVGCLLVILIIGAFLFEWRTALISVAAIPISLVAAGLVLYWSGAVVNTMILAGLVVAVGVVVDDAIIDVENILRRLRQHRLEGGTESTAGVILRASLEVRGAILYATIITLIAVVPVFFIGGLSGSFFRPLIGAYALAVIASLVVALTVTPALALILLRKAPIERRISPVTRWLQGRYTRIITRSVSHRKPAYVVMGAIAAMGLAVLPLLGQSLLPSFKERDFLMHWLLRPGSGHPEMVRITEAASVELRAIPGVRNFGAHIGQALLADEPYGIDFTENWISIDPNVDYDATLAKVQEVVDGYPGLQRDVQTYLKERVKEVLSGSSDSIVVRIFGPDLAELRAKADQVRETMAGIAGTADVKSERLVDIPQVQVTVDLEAANKYGLKPGDVRRATATIMAGEEVGDIFRGGRAYDVQVWSTPTTRTNLDDILAMPIDTPSGQQIRLDQVATVQVNPTPNHIDHENTARKIDVTANVKGRDLGSVAQDVEAALAGIPFNQEYHFEILGEYAERQAASARLGWLAIAAAIIIFFLLVTSFRSTRLAVISFMILPSALVGGVLAAWLGDGVLSLGSLVGFLAVLGIAARNGIMMISHYQHLESQEGEVFGRELVIRGSGERLAPILMTTLATALALVPLVWAGSVPGNEIEHPMAIVILGGLVTSTLLNLFVLPSLYLKFAKPSVRASDDKPPEPELALANSTS
jgi:CzcA family heavy metal efflux pump